MIRAYVVYFRSGVIDVLSCPRAAITLILWLIRVSSVTGSVSVDGSTINVTPSSDRFKALPRSSATCRTFFIKYLLRLGWTDVIKAGGSGHGLAWSNLLGRPQVLPCLPMASKNCGK